MAPTPTDVVTEIGKEYVEEHESRPHDPDVAWAFDVMADVNDSLFRDIPVPVEFQPEDPYDDYRDMADTVAREGVLRVFSGGDPHPVWDHHAEITSRAVHDWYGHLTLDVDFSPTGEFRKWEANREHYPTYCERVFFTEVVGQLGAVYYLEDGFADERFTQKVFPAPADWIDRMSRAVEYHAGANA